MILFLCAPFFLLAQTKVSRNIPAQGAREVTVSLTYGDIKIETWDKNEIAISGEVSINEGENDDSFQLDTSNEGGVIRIVCGLRDKESIPKRLTVSKGEKEYYFKAKSINDPVVQKFLDENGHDYSFVASGIVTDIRLTLYIPKNLSTSIEAKYGLIEFSNFEAPLRVDAKYGKVDATVPSAIGELTVRTRHGEIFSNLDIKFDQQPFEPRPSKDSWTTVTAKVGKGPVYWIESKYGNVYLRKKG